MPETRPLVSGELVINGGAPFSGAVAHVYLEDVSHADAPSKIVSQQDIPQLYYSGGLARIKFAMTGSGIDERARYTIRAHIDINGDGRIGSGDYVSIESHPVLTFGHGGYALVPVEKVS